MKHCILALFVFILTVGTARAHFIWAIPTAKGDSVAVVYSDSPQQDQGEGLKPAFVKAVTVSIRQADGRVETLKGTPGKDAYIVACPGMGRRTLAVVKNRMAGFKKDLLITGVSTAHLADSAAKVPSSAKVLAWDDLGMEILPRPDKGREIFQVVYRGNPVKNQDVEIYCPGDNDDENHPRVATDTEGMFTLKVLKPGRYGLYAEREFEEKGMQDGMPYTKRDYTSTLVIEIPAPRNK